MFVFKESSAAGEPLVNTACAYVDKLYQSTRTPPTSLSDPIHSLHASTRVR
jgi:hypothetical protein